FTSNLKSVSRRAGRSASETFIPFHIKMQLFVNDSKNYGTLLLLRDLEQSAMDNFTLKRIESLRRSMIDAFERLEKAGKLRDSKDLNNGPSQPH
ncbi:MAG: hypothetical protein P1P89_22160, partial [Desulfobacterales bacterium]|nr:hypothetical protein [Desulfobacterales bacterium]